VAHECDVSLKTLGRECRTGCVTCCLGRDVVLDEASGLYVIEPGSPGPCSQIAYDVKPGWVRDLEADRELASQESAAGDPLEDIIRREDAKRALEALSRFRRKDVEFMMHVFGLGGVEAEGLEGACAKLGIEPEAGKARYERILGRLRKELTRE
jgi:hypothetical protein